MAKRSYDQYCGLAHALDLVGERWTLLIVRELLTGPKRYSDLLERLPGIGTNLLADRLKFLQESGVVEKSHVYRLTAYGRRLEGPVIELARWGLESIGEPDEDDYYSGSWSILAMHAVFREEAAEGLGEEYEYRVGDDIFHAEVRDGQLNTSDGPADEPAFILETDVDTFRDIVTGDVDTEEGISSGRVRFEGSRAALHRSAELFGIGQVGRPSGDAGDAERTGNA